MTLGQMISNVSLISLSQWSIGLSHYPKTYFFCKVCLQMRQSHFCSTFMRLQFIYSIWEWRSPLGNIEEIEVLVGWWFVLQVKIDFTMALKLKQGHPLIPSVIQRLKSFHSRIVTSLPSTSFYINPEFASNSYKF